MVVVVVVLMLMLMLMQEGRKKSKRVGIFDVGNGPSTHLKRGQQQEKKKRMEEITFCGYAAIW